jgi:hypothetical protein
VRRLADGVRRSGSALLVELGPLDREQLTAPLEAHADAPLPAAVVDAIVVRAEGNPFFAEELLAAAGDRSGVLPRGLRDPLLQRVTGLDPPAQGLLRVAAAAGRDVGYPLLRAAAPRRRRSWRPTGRRQVGRRRRWPPRSWRRARQRPFSAWRRRSCTSSARSGYGTPCRTRPSW